MKSSGYCRAPEHVQISKTHAETISPSLGTLPCLYSMWMSSVWPAVWGSMEAAGSVAGVEVQNQPLVWKNVPRPDASELLSSSSEGLFLLSQSLLFLRDTFSPGLLFGNTVCATWGETLLIVSSEGKMGGVCPLPVLSQAVRTTNQVN